MVNKPLEPQTSLFKAIFSYKLFDVRDFFRIPPKMLPPSWYVTLWRFQHFWRSHRYRKKKTVTLRLLGMSWGVKTTCLEAPGVSLGGSGVSIGGVGSLRALASWRILKRYRSGQVSSRPHTTRNFQGNLGRGEIL